MKRNLYLMYAMALLQGMVFYGPIATLYRQAYGLSMFHITIIESISLGLTLLLELPWGYVADRIGYRRTMVFCSGLFLVSKVVFWQAEGFVFFLLERVLLSIVGAGLSGVEASVLYLSCPGEQSQRVFGRYQTCQQLGLLFAAGVYGLWIGSNYRLAAFLTVVSYALAALLSLGLAEVNQRKEVPTTLGSAVETLRDTVRNRRLMFLILGIALVEVVHQTVTVFTNQMKYIQVGMSTGVIAAVYMLMTACGLAGERSEWLTKRLGAKHLGLILICGSAVSCLGLAWVKTPLAAVAGVLMLRICFSVLQPLQTALQNQLIRSRDRATALSMTGLLMDLLAVFTEVVFGKIADFSLNLSMLFGGFLCMIGAVLYWASWKYRA